MKIVAYVTHDQVPRSRIWVAFLVHEPTKAHPAGDFHPVYFHAATEREARGAAETWWADQLSAAAKKREPPKRRKAAPTLSDNGLMVYPGALPDGVADAFDDEAI